MVLVVFSLVLLLVAVSAEGYELFDVGSAAFSGPFVEVVGLALVDVGAAVGAASVCCDE